MFSSENAIVIKLKRLGLTTGAIRILQTTTVEEVPSALALQTAEEYVQHNHYRIPISLPQLPDW